MDAEYLSECYVLAYEKALELTDDVNVAMNSAMAVIHCIANHIRVQTQNATIDVAKVFTMYKKQMTKSNAHKKKKEGVNVDETN